MRKAAVTLTERRPADVRLRPADVAALADRFRHAVELRPTATRNVWTVTARGYAGWFATPNVDWAVVPKFGWADVGRLVGGDAGHPSGGSRPRLAGAIVDLLAGRLATLMRERAAAGLVPGYRTANDHDGLVRGRLDLVRQARRPDPRPTTFAVTADDLTPDVWWNRVPKAAASELLARPGLSAAARADLSAAAGLFGGVTADATEPGADHGEGSRGAHAPRSPGFAINYQLSTVNYSPLLAWSRVVLGAGHPDGFLVPLEPLFQAHVGAVLASPAVADEPVVRLGSVGPGLPLVFRPDFVVGGRDGKPVAAWDAKWKGLPAAGPLPADAHQVLAYAAVLGCRAAGLIYPGRTFAVRRYASPGGVTLYTAKLRVAGPAAACERAANQLRVRVGSTGGSVKGV